MQVGLKSDNLFRCDLLSVCYQIPADLDKEPFQCFISLCPRYKVYNLEREYHLKL